MKLKLFSYLNHRKIDKDETTMLELREKSLIELCQLRKEEENNPSPRSQSNLGLVRIFFDMSRCSISCFWFIGSSVESMRGLHSHWRYVHMISPGKEIDTLPVPNGFGLSKYGLLTKREVKMAGYWPSSRLCVRAYWPRRSGDPQTSKERTRPISSHLDRTSLVSKGLTMYYIIFTMAFSEIFLEGNGRINRPF